MKDARKTKAKLIEELVVLRQRVSELEGQWTGPPVSSPGQAEVDDDLAAANRRLRREISERRQAEEALRASEEQYRTLVETVPLGVEEIDSGGVIQFSNEPHHKMMGLQKGELHGKAIWELLARDGERDTLREYLATLVRDQPPPTPYLTKNRTKDGREIDVRVDWNYKRTKAGEVTGFIAVISDVTEQKRAAAARRFSEARLATVVKASKDAMIAADEAGRVILFNPAAERMFGQPADGMMGQPLDCLMPEEYRDKHRRYMKEFFATGEPRRVIGQTVELPALTHGGTVFPIELSLSVGQHGDERFVLAVIRDITERQRAEQILRKNEARQALIFRSLPMAFYTAEASGDFGAAWVSEQIERISGFPPQRWVEDAGFWASRLHPDDRERALNDYGNLLVQDEVATEYRWRCADGTYHWFLDQGVLVRDESGRPKEAIGTWLDITERKRAEEKLRRAHEQLERRVAERTGELSKANAALKNQMAELERTQERLQLMSSAVEQSSEGIAVIDLEGNLLFLNHTFASMHGYTAEQLVGKHLSVFHTAEQMPAVEAANRGVQEAGEFHGEIWHTRRDGTVFPALMHRSLLRDESGQAVGMIGTAVDITEHKRIQEALRESEELLRLVIDASPNCVFVKEQSGKFLLANKMMARYHGTTPAEIIGKTDYDFVGSTIASVEEVERFLADDREIIETGQPKLIPDESFTLPDGTVRWHQTAKIPLSARGNPNCVLGVVTDITDRKLAEEALRYRVDFEALITSVSTGFINLPTDAIDEGISQALRQIGTFGGVDRSYVFVFEFSECATRMSNTHEWCAQGITAMREQLQNLPLSGFPWFAEQIKRLNTVHVPQVADLPPEAAAEKREWEAEQIQSLICVPMVCGGAVLGFVGFDSVRAEKTWSEDSVALLRLVGEIFANALARKRAHQALQASERKYRSLVENIPDVAWTTDAAGNTVFISGNIERLCGYTPEEIYETGPRVSMGRIHPEDEERVRDAFNKLFADQRMFDIEYRLQRKDGKWIWIHGRAAMTYELDGVLYADGVVSDITRRKEAEQALREREEELGDLFENAHDFILSVTPEGRLTYANRAWRESLGYGEDEVSGLSMFDTVHADSRDHCLAAFQSVLESGSATNMEAIFVAKDGRPIIVEGNCHCRGKEDQPPAIRGIFRDVSKRKRAEADLRESQRTLSNLMSNLPGMAYRCRNDRDWTMEFVSDGCVNLTGYQPDDLIDNRKIAYAALVHPGDRQAVWEDVQIALRDRVPFRLLYRVLPADGEQKWVWEQGRGIFSDSGELQALEGFISDITERRRAEEALRESQQMLQLVLDTIPTRVFWKDRDSVYLGCNEVFARDAGLSSPNEIVGKTDYDLAWKKEETDFYRECDRRVMGSDTPEYHIIEPQLQADGKAAWLDTHKIPLHDSNGRVVGILGTYEDITERKRAEEALRRAERLASLGTTVAGVAHELNNPLTSICGLSQLLARDESAGRTVKSLAREIGEQGLRCSRIVENLLEFGRERRPTRRRVSINALVANCLRLTRHDPNCEHVEIRTDYCSDLPTIVADPYQLEQVFINIITNARDALVRAHDEKRLEIRTSRAGDEVCVEFHDSGPGIEDPGKVFDPFYTTKTTGSSTGLGLSVSHGIVEEHAGSITARNTGKGACFAVRLPISQPSTTGGASKAGQ